MNLPMQDMTSGVWSNFVMTNYNIFIVDDTQKYLNSLGIKMRKTNCFTPECAESRVSTRSYQKRVTDR